MGPKQRFEPTAASVALAVRDGAQLLPVGRESGPLDDQQPNKGRGVGNRRRSRDGARRDRGWPDCIEPVILGHQARQAGASVPRCRGPGRLTNQRQQPMLGDL